MSVSTSPVKTARANTPKEPPPLTLNERDRRYKAIREQLAQKGVDGVVVTGTNLLYLSNALPGEMFGFLPTDEAGAFTGILTWRYLADVSPQIILDAQDWVRDIRSGRDASPIVERIKELKLENGTIGLAGPVSHGAYRVISSALPSLKIVDVSDVFENVRTTKSAEEIGLLDWANYIFDAAVERVREVGPAGVLGRATS
jgi:Xaa-Pro dipeptidase